MQGSEIELGGFRGRTNKLVDGCYAWWVGGSYNLLAALGVGETRKHQADQATEQDTDEWDDVDGSQPRFLLSNMLIEICIRYQDSIFNRKALQEYILYAAQHPAGGLRDKPPK
jgi:protein farnesyltransferase subunit beta